MDEIKKIAVRDTKDFVDVICKGMSENDANETLGLVKSALNTDGNILGISQYNEAEIYRDGFAIKLNTLYPELKKAFMSNDTEKTLIDTSLSFKIESANVLNMNMVSIENGNILFVSLDDLNLLKSMYVTETYDVVEDELYTVSHMLNSTDLNIKFIQVVGDEEIELNNDNFIFNIEDEYYFDFESLEDMKVKLFIISNDVWEEEEEVISEEELQRQEDAEDYFKPTDWEQKPGTYKVGITKKNYYDEVISKGIKDEYNSIEFVLDGGFNMLKSGSVYMNEEDARAFYPLKERLNREQGIWVISGGQDVLPHIEISLLGHLEKEEIC